MSLYTSRGRDIGKPGFGHCSRINIELREKKVRCNRELNLINKNLEGRERQHVRNMRKFDSAQRGVMLLIGENPYPDCTREDAIFLHNQPGFCFRRNGKPRCFSSLHESKSRKILDDMDGKEGLRANPALNVVSDTPTLGEILSSPEIVQILCELRNTAALMTNEQLFQAFADQLGKTHRKFPFFKEFQGPLDYLKQYRRNLIQEFFDTLKTEAEMRLFAVPTDPTSQLYQLASASPVSSAGYKSSSASKDSEKNGGTSSVNSNFTSRASTGKEEDVDFTKSYDRKLVNRIVNRVRSARKAPVFGGAVPPPPPQRQSNVNMNNKAPQNSPADVDANKKDAQLEQDTTSSVQDSVSTQDIFATTDYIPTSQGYMTVEDWNVAVLDQLQKAQDDEENKKETRKKIHSKPLPVSTEHKDQVHENDDHRQVQRKSTDLKDDSANNNTNNGQDDAPKLANNMEPENDDNATEELRQKLAAAVAAEEEAKYRLDQKIMGLAGITSLYKSSNIGFAKYFEHKDELRDKEMNRRENSKSRNTKRSSSRGDESGGWFGPTGLNRTSGPPGMIPSTNTLITDTSSVGTKDAASVASSKRRISLSKKTMKKALNSARNKTYQRQEFDSFVKGLITNIEEISAVGNQVSGLSKRRPVGLQRLINPLVRLLKRDSLFDTLNVEDVFFSEFEGGKKELERLVAAQLPNPSKRPKSRGIAFKLPSKTSMPTAAGTVAGITADGNSDAKVPSHEYSGDPMCYPNQQFSSSMSNSEYSSPPYSARSSYKPSTAASSGTTGERPFSDGESHKHPPHHHYHHKYINTDSFGGFEKYQVAAKETCWICPPRSLQRVCCAACRAKTQQACSSVLRRDKNCKVTLSMNSWKIPGMHPPNWKRKEHLLAAAEMMTSYNRKQAHKIPAKLRKFYESTYPIPTDAERSRSVFLEPPADILDTPPSTKHAAPTPVYLKKRLYPLPAVLTNVPMAVAATALNTSASTTTGPQPQQRSVGFFQNLRFGGGGVTNEGGDVNVGGRMFNFQTSSVLPPKPGKSHSQASSSVKTAVAGGRGGEGMGVGGGKGSSVAGTFPQFFGAQSGGGGGGNDYVSSTKGIRAQMSSYGQQPGASQSRRSLLMANGKASGSVYPETKDSNDSGGDFESWTLKVSKFDILKLRHELDGEGVKEKMKQFEAQYLRRPNSN